MRKDSVLLFNLIFCLLFEGWLCFREQKYVKRNVDQFEKVQSKANVGSKIECAGHCMALSNEFCNSFKFSPDSCDLGRISEQVLDGDQEVYTSIEASTVPAPPVVQPNSTANCMDFFIKDKRNYANSETDCSDNEE